MGAQEPKHKVTIAEAFRDVVIAALNKGQLLLLGVIGCLSIVLWRYPADRLPELAARIELGLTDYSLGGWIGMVVCILAWYFHLKRTRDTYDRELTRVPEERNKLQDHAMKQRGQRVKSSKGS